jgi:hypothetical protein
VICFPHLSIADGKNIFIVVTTSKQANTEPRYHGAAEATFEYAGVGNDTPYILAQDGMGWKIQGKNKPPYTTPTPPINGQFKTASDLEAISNLPEFKASNSTLMLFVGHGARGSSIDPEDSKVLGWGGDNPTFKELREQIKKINRKHPVRIVCLTCYGGGIHTIAHRIKKVCSVATAPYMLPSLSAAPQSHFNEGFLDHLENTKSHTFAEAAIAGFRNDPGNLNLGQLSSFDYLDRIFKRGPYNPELISEFEGSRGVSRTDLTFDKDHAVLDIKDRPLGKYRSPSPRTLGAAGLTCPRTVVSPSDQFLNLAENLGPIHSHYTRRSDKRERDFRLKMSTLKNIRIYLKNSMSIVLRFLKNFFLSLQEEVDSFKNSPIEEFGEDPESEIENFRAIETEFHVKMLDLKAAEEDY